jgi:hypothetical protein
MTFAPVLDPEEVDAAWMTQMLRARGRLNACARVTELSAVSCGTGQLGDSFRFKLHYAPAGAGPASLVGKFASSDPTRREFGRSSGYYQSEIRFYQQLAARLPVALADALHAELADNQANFVLLMEDLAPARQVDQVEACSAEESALVLDQPRRCMQRAGGVRSPVRSIGSAARSASSIRLPTTSRAWYANFPNSARTWSPMPTYAKRPS